MVNSHYLCNTISFITPQRYKIYVCGTHKHYKNYNGTKEKNKV